MFEPYIYPKLSCCIKLIVLVSQSAKNLGLTLNMHLPMAAHVVNLIRTANFELHCVSSVRHYLSVEATKTCFRFRSFTTGLL